MRARGAWFSKYASAKSRVGVRIRKDQPSSPSASAFGMLRGSRSCEASVSS